MKNTNKNLDNFLESFLEDYQKPFISVIEIKENLLSTSGDVSDDPFTPDLDW